MRPPYLCLPKQLKEHRQRVWPTLRQQQTWTPALMVRVSIGRSR
jgi:hypothetical protein